MAHDTLGAQARDELGITETLSARPIQAALTSAASFAVGAAMPLLAVAAVSGASLIPVVSGTSLAFLAIPGGLAARVGGASVAVGALRVTFWGALAMALTAGVGTLFGAVGVTSRRRQAMKPSPDPALQSTVASGLRPLDPASERIRWGLDAASTNVPILCRNGF